MTYQDPGLDGDTESIMVRVVGVVMEQLSISFQLRSLLEVDVVNPPPLVMCCLLHQLHKALLLEVSRDKIVWLLVQADVEIARDENAPPRIDKFLQVVSHIMQTAISRSVDMDGVKEPGGEHGHLEVC